MTKISDKLRGDELRARGHDTQGIKERERERLNEWIRGGRERLCSSGWKDERAERMVEWPNEFSDKWATTEKTCSGNCLITFCNHGRSTFELFCTKNRSVLWFLWNSWKVCVHIQKALSCQKELHKWCCEWCQATRAPLFWKSFYALPLASVLDRISEREGRIEKLTEPEEPTGRVSVSTFSSKAKMHETLAFILFAGGTDVSVNRDETGENEDREKSGGKVDKGSWEWNVHFAGK